MSDVSVLVVSTSVDVATDAVVQRLTEHDVDVQRLNTEAFPFHQTLAYYPTLLPDSERLVCDGRALPTPISIWYRRIRSSATPDGMDDGVATFCRQEARAALIGGLLAIDARWMSHPSAIWQAEFKPYQLQVASAIGLRIPRTVVTNDPSAVRAASAHFGELIVKPTRTGHLINNGAEYAVYTSRILGEHLEQLESARWSPSIYQELIPKKYDIRVTIVGDQCFSAAIDSQSDPAASVDWRRTNNPYLPHHVVYLPAALEAALLRFMRRLGLRFGAIDLIETSDDDYVFLEVNPNGQWLWLDEMLGLGITDAVADWLRFARLS